MTAHLKNQKTSSKAASPAEVEAEAAAAAVPPNGLVESQNFQQPGAISIVPRGGGWAQQQDSEAGDEDDHEDADNGIVSATVVDMTDVENEVRDRIIGSAVHASQVTKSTSAANDEQELTLRQKHVGIVLCSCLGLLLLATVLFLTQRNSGDDSPSPTMSPTSFVDVMSGMNDAERQLFDALVALLPESGDNLSVTSSPQFQAFQSLTLDTDVELLLSDTRELQTRYGLAVLYYATNGDQWLNNDGWLTWGEDATYCDWYWSGCDLCSSVCDDFGSLQRISLSENDLRGSLPAEISLLDTQYIVLKGNSELNGTIPSTLFANHPQLLQFDISATSISGPIPSSIGTVTSLTILSLENSQVTGTIPSWIGLLTNLEILHLSELSAFGPSTIPEEIYSLTKLVTLQLRESHVTGTLSPSFGKLSKLEWMDFGRNELTGSIPSEIGSLSTIRALKLGNNNFTSNIPSTIDHLVGAIQIFLQYNELTGTIPSTLSNMTGLKDFRAYENSLSGSFPVGMERMASMKALNVGRNKLTGAIPFDAFAQWHEAKSVRLTRNEFTGTLPSNPSFWGLPGLYAVVIDGNRLTGTIPSEIGLSPSLKSIDLTSNRLSGSIPRTIGNAAKLEEIHLSNNALDSILPTELAWLSRLEELFVANNTMLTGSLPSTFANLQNLVRVDVYGTEIVGDLPFCQVEELTIQCDSASCSCCAEGAVFCV